MTRGHGGSPDRWPGLPPRRSGPRDSSRDPRDARDARSVQHLALAAKGCTDIRGIYGAHSKWTWGGRFYDNGRYIGHDEPDVRFLSAAKGSGNNVTWNETLGTDPAKPPTVKRPGHDRTHWAS